MSNTFLTQYLLGCKRWFELVSLWTKSQSVTIQMNDTKQYVPVVLFITLYKVILTFESVDEILMCGHSNERYWAVISCGSVYYAAQGGSNFWVSGRNPTVCPLKWTAKQSVFPSKSVKKSVKRGVKVLRARLSPVSLSVFSLVPDLLFDCSRVLEYAKMRTVLQSTIQMNGTQQWFPAVLFIMLCKVAVTFKSVNEILKCVHSNECHRAVLSCGAVYNVVQANCNAWHGENTLLQ